jgi:hypothetical protein
VVRPFFLSQQPNLKTEKGALLMAIKFETNIPVKLTFPWGDFREISSRYGQQYAYSVDLAGQRDKLFATPGLHHKLQEAGVRAGSVFTITKIEIEGNRKDWRIEGEEQPAQAPVAAGEPRREAQANGLPVGRHGKPATTNGTTAKNGHTSESADFQGLKQAMQLCLNAAYGVCEGLEVDLPFTTEDVRALGITLFLECSRKGIQPQESEGLPF